MVTRPESAAWIGVPVGTPMSMPGGHAYHARRSQNGEVIGPLTGQMSWPDPRLTGPLKALGAAFWSRFWIDACWASMLLRSSSALLRLDRTWASTVWRPLRALWRLFGLDTSLPFEAAMALRCSRIALAAACALCSSTPSSLACLAA